MSDYTQGGYIGTGAPSAPIRLHADECLIDAADVAAMRLRCSRPDHPTPTSDCGKPGAQIEPPARD